MNQVSGADVVVVMPPLGDGSGELILESWLRAVGDAVHKGDPLFSVETDKTSVVVEALATGILAEILVGTGEAAAEGEPIARIRSGEPIAGQRACR
jgi:pyruvate/2-oxoglutarate dehydrogenase complex dihydrolipoamide acyltransferase (E2) component